MIVEDDFAIVFDSILNHSDVARNMKVVAAGHCRLPDELNDHVSAWGESITLDIKSRGDVDAEIIKQQFYETD